MEERVKSLKEQCIFLKKTNSDRKNYIKDLFKPQFIRYIGIFGDYEDSIKTLKSISFEDKEKWLFFNDEIILDEKLDLDYISKIKEFVEKFGDRKYSTTNMLKIFPNEEINQVFLQCLDYVIDLAKANENKIKNNFIDFTTNLICLTKQYISRKKFDYVYNNKCIYFGNIEKNDIYFLILLYRMMFDVIYINPTEDSEQLFQKIDSDCLSTLVISDIKTKDTDYYSLDKIIERGDIIRVIKSTASYIEENVHNNLYNEKDFFKTNQFLNYNIIPILFEGVMADIYNTLPAEAQLREGFEIKEDNKSLFLPHFFIEIQGTDDKYIETVNYILSLKNTICFTNKEFEEIIDSLSLDKKNYNIQNNILTINEDILANKNIIFSELIFTKNEDDTFNLDEIKKLSFYKFRKLKDTTTNYMFKKMNELLNSNIFKRRIKLEEKLNILFNLFITNESIFQKLENFDFTNYVPKVIIYLGENEILDEDTTYILVYLNMLGLDVIIFSPMGKSGIDRYIKNIYSQIILERTENITLEKIINYDEKGEKKEKKGGFLSFLLKW